VGAAYAGGKMTLEHAVYKICVRSVEQVKTRGSGKMCSLRVSNLSEISKIVSKYSSLFVAAYNSPSSVTLAGSHEDIDAVCAENSEKSKVLDIPSAYHTKFMDPIKDSFLDNYAKVRFPPCNPSKDAPVVYSIVDGCKYTGEFDGEYWWKNIRQPVLFKDAMEKLLAEENPDVFVEITASKTLPGPIYQCMNGDQKKSKIIVSSMEKRDTPEEQNFLEAIGKLYCYGVPTIDWSAFGKGVYCPIPTYAWNYSKCWQEAQTRRVRRLGLVEKSYLRGLLLAFATSFGFY
jgi:acyl transferase domain-containing protein